MSFKIGDRVKEIGRKCYENELIEIIDIFDNRIHLKYLNVFNVNGSNMLFWVNKSDVFF
jgi:hypothetical protein